MKISYLEAEKRGWSYEDVYVVTFSELDFYVKELLKLYPSVDINNIKGYALQILKKMLDMWESIHIVYSHNQDYVSICTLCRSILDNLVVIYHIYLDKNEEELIIKHYLYILDGINSRLKNMGNLIEYDGTIIEEEFLELEKHLKETKKSDLEAKEFILNIFSNYNFIDNQIVNQANWRYKKLTPDSSNKNQLDWMSLYSKIDSRPFFKKLMYDLSPYVHGLSLSNLKYEKKDETFEPLFCLSIECIDAAIKALKTIYNHEITYMHLNFLKSEAAKIIKYSIKEEYLHLINNGTKKK